VATWVWAEALEALERTMPGSSGFLLDQITGIPSDAWRRFPLEADDVTLGEQLLDEIGTALGDDLFVVTDASWRPDVGPFAVSSWRLATLIREHASRTGEPFFTADVVILSPADGALVAVHRAGLIAVAHGVPYPRPRSWPLAHLTDTGVLADRDPPLEWTHPVGELYPESAVTLPSGRVVNVRWFETDADVSFIAPAGDFQISYRGPVEDLDDVLAEFLSVVGLSEGDVQRLLPSP
jgi:hypothetical protein